VSPRENLEKESKKENEETKEKPNEADEEEELKNRILSAGLSHVGKHGWTRLALAAGAESAGYISVVSGLFPRDEELVFYHISKCNSRLDTWMEEQVQEYKVTFLFRQNSSTVKLIDLTADVYFCGVLCVVCLCVVL